MLIPATQIRIGMLLNYQNDLYRVMAVTHITPGNWRGMVQTKLRSIRTGNSTENRFRSEDKVDRITLEQHEMEYLYSDGDMHHFMNNETFEQVGLSAEVLGDAVDYLLPNIKLAIEFYESRPVGIELPLTVEMKVMETEPAIKGATVSNVGKPAKMETGLVVQVPAFINEGDVIRIDTATGSYIERAAR